MQDLRTSIWRLAVHLSVAMFAVSMFLDAYRPLAEFIPGHSAALFAEVSFWEFSWKCLRIGLGMEPAMTIGTTGGWPMILAGATANHLFVLAYISALCRRTRMAAVLSMISALCAMGCLLPDQIVDSAQGWRLGPGYFVWCSAPLVLSIAMVRGLHQAMRTQSQPLFLFHGLLTSSTPCRMPVNPAT